jgi:hypothetical protein
VILAAAPSFPDGGGGLPPAQGIIADGFDAFVLASGLDSPDGLAFSGDGVLYAALEGSGLVVAVAPDGSTTTVLEGIDSPEGICFGPDGTLYVTSDIGPGAVLASLGGSPPSRVAEAEAPEGVAVTSGGTVYFTQSSAQLISSPLDLVTSLSEVLADSVRDVLVMRYIVSFSDAAVGPDGIVYVANEAAGPGTGPSVFAIDPAEGRGTVFCTGPGFCEGLSFRPGGGFPLLVTQENVMGDGGVLWTVDEDGSSSVLATGFADLEDAAVSGDGCICLSDDGDGCIVLLVPRGRPRPGSDL